MARQLIACQGIKKVGSEVRNGSKTMPAKKLCKSVYCIFCSLCRVVGYVYIIELSMPYFVYINCRGESFDGIALHYVIRDCHFFIFVCQHATGMIFSI